MQCNRLPSIPWRNWQRHEATTVADRQLCEIKSNLIKLLKGKCGE